MSEDDVIATEAKRIESDALYTAQANFHQAVVFGRLHVALGLPAVVLSALAGTAILAGGSDAVAGACALAAAVFATADLFISSERRASEHSAQGVEYRKLQHDARRLRTLDVFSAAVDTRRARLEELAGRHTDLNRMNRPSEWAFRHARRKIASGELLQPGDDELR